MYCNACRRDSLVMEIGFSGIGLLLFRNYPSACVEFSSLYSGLDLSVRCDNWT